MPVGEGWDVPSEVRDRVEFHWFHVQPGRSLLVCMLSAAPLWYVGHFESGRMKPCAPVGCQSCARGVGKQLRFVVSAVDVRSKQVGVLELSKGVADVLRGWADQNGGLHGMLVEFSKASKSKHSRMEVDWVRESAPSWAFCLPGLDLKEVLSRTWDRQEG